MPIDRNQITLTLDRLDRELSDFDQEGTFLSSNPASRDLQWIKKGVHESFEILRSMFREHTDEGDELARRAKGMFITFIQAWGWDFVHFQKGGKRFIRVPWLCSDPFNRRRIDTHRLIDCLDRASELLINALRNNPDWAEEGLYGPTLLAQKINDALREFGAVVKGAGELPVLEEKERQIADEIRRIEDDLYHTESELEAAMDQDNVGRAELLCRERARLRREGHRCAGRIARLRVKLARAGGPMSLHQPTRGENGLAPIDTLEGNSNLLPVNYAEDNQGTNTKEEMLASVLSILHQHQEGKILVAIISRLQRSNCRITRTLLRELGEQFPDIEWDESLVRDYCEEGYKWICGQGKGPGLGDL